MSGKRETGTERAVKLWLKNDRGRHEKVVGIAAHEVAEAWEQGYREEALLSNATGCMAAELRRWHEEEADEIEGWAGNALALELPEVDWLGIARGFVEDAAERMVER